MEASVKPPAVVIGGWSVAVPVVRSLGGAGIDVHVVGSAGVDPARHSRHCASFTDVGTTAEALAGRWLEWLRSARAPRGAVVLPAHDAGLELVARHREALVDAGYVPVEADDEVILAMLSKRRTQELAEEIGTEMPRTVIPSGKDELDEIVGRFEFPCALKPVNSMLFQRQFGTGNKLLVADGPDELREAFAHTSSLGLEMMVTEIIPGSDELLLSHCGYLDERGEPIAQFTFRKLRQYPPHFGLGSYVLSDWNEEVIEAGLRFLRGVGLRGLFHVEFKRDPRDGRLKLLECNHRFTIEAVFSPVDLPLLAYNRALGLAPPPARPYRTGVYQWNPIPDTRAFRSYRRNGELMLGEWIRSLLHRQSFHVFRWSDPWPTVVFHLKWLGRIARRRFRRQRRDPLLPR